MRKCNTSTGFSRGSRVQTHDSVFLAPLADTPPSTGCGGERDQYFRENARRRVTRRRKEESERAKKKGGGEDRDRKRRENKKKEAWKIKAGSHERLTRRACTRGVRDVCGVIKKERKRERVKAKKKKRKKGKGKKKNSVPTVAGRDVKTAANGRRLLAVRFLNEFTRLNESSP